MAADEEALIALARSAGAHALELFGIALLLVVGTAATLWWGLRRYGRPRDSGWLPRSAFLLLHLAAGFAVMVGAAVLFAELADRLGDGSLMGRLDEAFSLAMSRETPLGALQAFAVLTHLGDPVTLTLLGVVVTGLLVWLRRPWLALGWASAQLGNALLNPTLKLVFQRARPVHEHGLVSAGGFSFPSGHSSASLVAWGMLAYLMIRLAPPRWQLPAVLAAAALAFAVGSSRVFLQVHWPSDVLAGFASGTAWLAVCIVSIEATRHYRRRIVRMR